MPPNWIDEVISELEHVETPRSWLWWSLACAVSAAMANKYFLLMLKGAVLVKPNIYVILLGESGLGKEFPISLAINLVDKADITRLFAGRNSIQGIVADLATFVNRENKEPIEDSRGLIANGELSTAIIQDPDALTLLTDLYDHKIKWANNLKGGKEKLRDPYITCLFGSSPAHFYDSIPQVNIEGGYIGRNFIVFEEKRYKDTDLFGSEDEDPKLEFFPFSKHAPFLEEISKRGGRIIPDGVAKEYFNIWRRHWRIESKPDKTGFVNRVPVHVLKVAMILCASQKDSNLIINRGHIEEAIEKVTHLVYASDRTTKARGVDPLSVQTRMVLDALLTAKDNQLTRKQLLNKGLGNYDMSVLDRIVENLKEIGWVDCTRVNGKGGWDILIELKGQPLEEYRKFISDRKVRK